MNWASSVEPFIAVTEDTALAQARECDRKRARRAGPLSPLPILVALAEYVIRRTLPAGSFWPVPIVVVAFALMLISFLIPLAMRWFPGTRSSADAMLAWPFLVLIALLAWHGLRSVAINERSQCFAWDRPR